MTDELEAPVTIVSFDRPQYLERVCLSLKAQHHVSLRDDRVILAQDGAVNAISGRRAARDDDVAQCVRIFRKHFPRGQVLDHSVNIGVALNIRRAETFVFEDMNCEYGYFFEDDLELGQIYLHIMERMRAAFTPDMRIAYWAAYGNHRKASTGPEVTLQPMGWNWGFGLFREPWRDMMKELEPYFSIVSQVDYAYRPYLSLFNLMHAGEFAVGSTSQDAFRKIAAARLGYARVMTDVCFARYIGEEGLHFTPQNFRREGFDRMRAVSEGAFSLQVTRHAVDEVRDRAALDMRRFRSCGLDELLDAWRARFDDDDRMVSAEETRALFRLLTDIRTEPPKSLMAAAGKITIREMRGRILDEFDVVFKNPSPRRQREPRFHSDKELLQPLTASPVTRADVIAAYRFLLGRNPESEAAIGFHLNKESIAHLRGKHRPPARCLHPLERVPEAVARAQPQGRPRPRDVGFGAVAIAACGALAGRPAARGADGPAQAPGSKGHRNAAATSSAASVPAP
jgi:hypothetical protein